MQETRKDFPVTFGTCTEEEEDMAREKELRSELLSMRLNETLIFNARFRSRVWARLCATLYVMLKVSQAVYHPVQALRLLGTADTSSRHSYTTPDQIALVPSEHNRQLSCPM